MRVLLVDDNAANLKLMQVVLTRAGFSVEPARNAATALARLAEFHPDLVLSDVHMPEMNGLALAAEVKRLYPNLPIVALSARATAEDQDSAFLAGFDGFVMKPVDTRIVAETLRAIVLKLCEVNGVQA